MRTTLFALLVLSCGWCPLFAQQETARIARQQGTVIPPRISYQGVLTDDAGNPLDGTFSMNFQLFPTPTDGTPVWGETQSDVQVSNGIFQVYLGNAVPLELSFDMPYFLDVSVEGNTLAPRIELASSPYSFTTAGLQGNPVSAHPPVAGDVLKWNGSEWQPGTPFDETDPPGERITLYKKELSVIDPAGVLLNLVATDGGVGIRFYKDFGFGNEMETNPWHMGWIEGVSGYQGLAILRDWAFTSALWEEDGKFLTGKLHPHPPANDPAGARFEVRGTLDELQTLIRAHTGQSADVFQVTNAEGANSLAVRGEGSIVVGSSEVPRGIILFDTATGNPYVVTITNGNLSVTAAE